MSERTYHIYAIDFDGTIVEDAWPFIGALKPEAAEFIGKLQARGDQWILLTMREGQRLKEAVDFLKSHGLVPNAINDNTKDMQYIFLNNPRKIYADTYIDDHNAGGLRWED